MLCLLYGPTLSSVHDYWKDHGALVAKFCLTLATPWTVGCQAPLSIEFSWQGYWRGLPFPSPDLGIEPRSPALQADSLPTELRGKLDGKTIELTIWTFVGKVISLLFNTLSRFVIAFLPTTNGLLISWLQSPSTVIMEIVKYNLEYGIVVVLLNPMGILNILSWKPKVFPKHPCDSK